MHGPTLTSLLLILLVFIVFFGGKGKISSMMTDLAQGIKGFKKGLSEEEAKPSETIKVEDGTTIEAKVVSKRKSKG